MPLFFAGSGESADTIICALEIPDNDWFKRALVEALTLMCDQNNWGERGTATADFARDKACEMNETMEFDVIIPSVAVGTIAMFPTDTTPAKWLKCAGSSLLRADYPELFAVIGTQYGAADGTHFNLPNWKNKSPYGGDSTGIPLGTDGGQATQTLAVNHLPEHHHTQHIGNNQTMKAFVAGGSGTFTPAGAATSSAAEMITADTGASLPFGLLHPVFAINYIIYAGV